MSRPCSSPRRRYSRTVRGCSLRTSAASRSVSRRSPTGRLGVFPFKSFSFLFSVTTNQPSQRRLSWAQLGRKTSLSCAQSGHFRGVRATESMGLWRRRVGVEPTIRSAKERIAGFEGRENHRTLFAPGGIIEQSGTCTSEGFQRLGASVSERLCGWR